MCDEEWLNKINDEFRRSNTPPGKRPFEAISRLSQESGVSISLSSPEARRIFDWFKNNSKPGAHAIGVLYESCCFYDATFWKVVVPIGYGTFKLNALEALPEMPHSVKNALMSDPPSRLNYMLFWADCVDFGYGYDDMIKLNREDKFGLEMLRASYEELQAAKSMLLEHRINRRAMMASRMSTEMILKSYIAMKVGLSDQEAMSLGHNLEKSFHRFIEAAGNIKLKALEPLTAVFPEIHRRYEGQRHNPSDLWLAFGFAQTLAAYLTREFTDRDMQSQILSSNSAVAGNGS